VDGVATGPGAAGAPAGNGPDPGVNPAGILPNTSIRLAGTRPDAEADAAAAVAGRARSRALAARLATGWPLRRIFGIGVLIAALFAVLAITLGGAALANLAGARDRVVGKIDPAAFRTSQLGIAFLNQETGVRGYALSAQRTFLKPYVQGLAQQQQEISALRRLLAGMPAASADLAQVIARADTWRSSYAEPTIRQVTARGRPVVSPAAGQGKAEFDSLRGALDSLQADLAGERVQAVSRLNNSAATLNAICIGIGIALVIVLVVLAFGLERSVIRPLSRLAADARKVADGDFAHHVESSGPQEMRTVGTDVDSMRERIVAELSAVRAAHVRLEARTEDLQRSNAELEQFAYVASHDLQEPLRKVASFCQLLQRRYAGRLDEKADQYIEHAVDGAKRMQALINDLLAFSRVGTKAKPIAPTDCNVIVRTALADLQFAIEDSGARVDVDDLPMVMGDATQLSQLFRNLLSNAIKFHRDEPPVVRVSTERTGASWRFTVSDNGIGIAPEYFERIFVIFQRLHGRSQYAGTGIGLAICKKIVERHGGQIEVRSIEGQGSTFTFTLPALQ